MQDGVLEEEVATESQGDEEVGVEIKVRCEVIRTAQIHLIKGNYFYQ